MSPPIYNEATKSYIAHAIVPTGHSTWLAARRYARSLSFGGVRGRLAIVDSGDRMKFIHDNFDVDHATWVGARFFCKGRKLLWENGKIQKRGDYTRWHRKWNRTQIKCPTVAFMPLYLTPEKEGFYWQASGPAKGFKPILVEFPTGKR